MFVDHMQKCGELLVYPYDEPDTWPHVTEKGSSNNHSNFPLGAMQVHHHCSMLESVYAILQSGNLLPYMSGLSCTAHRS